MKKIFPLFLVLLALAGNAMAKTERADYDVIPLPKEVKEDSTQVFTEILGSFLVPTAYIIQCFLIDKI